MFRKYQRGFIPIVVLLIIAITASSAIILKNGVLVGPQPTPDKGFKASSSATTKIEENSPSNQGDNSNKTSPTPTTKTNTTAFINFKPKYINQNRSEFKINAGIKV